MAKLRKYRQQPPAPPEVKEQAPAYPSVRKTAVPALANFTYKKFRKIADKMPLTQSEWASILHLSERTLQRYAQQNSSFEGIYTDRILQLQELFNLGLGTFTDAAAFYQWLKKEKQIMGQVWGFEALSTGRGIQELSDQLVRIQHGVYA